MPPFLAPVSKSPIIQLFFGNLMTKIRLTLPILALMVAVAAAGCGGGSDGGGTGSASSGGPPSKALFIKRAEEICGKADKKQHDEAANYREEHFKELSDYPQ